ncbi:AraC family transcriptional regulator [Rhodobacteraceae bacterium PD-2]|nr:AraC family transcriptional regulator [Rhodobacteraceae bacterium PD-2]
MNDPLADVVSLLKPVPSISKRVTGGGGWRVERTEMGNPFYCAIVAGGCLLTPSGRDPIRLEAGDFVLVPEIFDFVMTGLVPPGPQATTRWEEISPGVIRQGDPEAPTDVIMLVGHCAFASRDRSLLVSLLPDIVHVHGQDRLMHLVQMIDDETRSARVARDMVLERLLELLLIEALRSTADTIAFPGMLRGLADPQLSVALRKIHADPGRPHSVAALAKSAAMSRSTFYERFHREIGAAPMEYVTNWRMALARDMLMKRTAPIAEIAREVGYGSASAFSVAFVRHTGRPPGAFSNAQR